MLGPAVEPGYGKEPSFSPAWDLQAARRCTREEQMWPACFSSSLAEQGGNGAAAPPSIACQHCRASEGSRNFSAKKSALTQYSAFHKGLVPSHLSLLALLVPWCSALRVGLVVECLFHALVNWKRLLVVWDIPDVCPSSQGQQLGLCRAVTHCRSLLCSALQAQFILENRRGGGAKKTSDNLKWIYLYEKSSVGYAEERTPKVIPHFSSNGFN